MRVGDEYLTRQFTFRITHIVSDKEVTAELVYDNGHVFKSGMALKITDLEKGHQKVHKKPEPYLKLVR